MDFQGNILNKIRIVWGIVFKHTGYKFVIALNLIIQIVVYSTYRFTAYTPGLYLIFVFLIGCCFGGFTSVNPTYCQIVFGNKWGSKIFGIYTYCQYEQDEIEEITFSDKIILLQIGENGFNDEGVFCVTIPKEDLKKLNFDNCEFAWGQS